MHGGQARGSQQLCSSKWVHMVIPALQPTLQCDSSDRTLQQPLAQHRSWEHLGDVADPTSALRLQAQRESWFCFSPAREPEVCKQEEALPEQPRVGKRGAERMTAGSAGDFTLLGTEEAGGCRKRELGKFSLLFQEEKIFSIASWHQRFLTFSHPEKIKPGASAR